MPLYTTETTLDIGDGEERDYAVRLQLEVGPGMGMGGGWGAEPDGDPEVKVNGKWVSVSDLNLGDKTLDWLTDHLCQYAMSDDSDACAEADADEAREERS